MHPILATGLAAIGERVIDRILTPSAKPAQQAQEAQFSKRLAPGTVQPPSKLEQLLQSRQVRDSVDLLNLRDQLGNELMTHPQLSGYMIQTRGDEALQLSMSEGSHFTIKSTGGKCYGFSADSELGQIAKLFHQVSQMSYQSRHTSPGNFGRLAAQIGNSSGLTANWTLRTGA